MKSKKKEAEVSKLAGGNILINLALEGDDREEDDENESEKKSARSKKSSSRRMDSVAVHSNPFKVKLLPQNDDAKNSSAQKAENVRKNLNLS